MATRTRLKKRAELKATSLTRNTFRSLCTFIAIFLSVVVGGAVVMSLRGTPSDGEIPISLLMFLGQAHILIPIRPVSTEPKQ
jgi:hypothetical protein